MYKEKVLSVQNLDFNFEATKKRVNHYFISLESLELELAKLNAQKGLIVNYDFSIEYKKQPYTPIGKDEFSLSAKECKEEQLKKYISSYYWARAILSDNEKIYIKEKYINHKYDDEIADLLGMGYNDSYGFKKLKKSAIYKFADFLNLVVEN